MARPYFALTSFLLASSVSLSVFVFIILGNCPAAQLAAI